MTTVAHMRTALPEMLCDIKRIVKSESPSADLVAVARSAELVADVGTARLGTEPEHVLVKELVPRTALLPGLVADLLAEPSEAPNGGERTRVGRR